MNTPEKEHFVHVNHLGFLCDVRKKAVVKGGQFDSFEIQDMNLVAQERLGEYENWEVVLKGHFVKRTYPMGTYSTADFSDLTKPGIYRVVLKGVEGRSYQFMISDGNFRTLIGYFLDFAHNWRSGYFENDWRTVTHLDDAIRSDNGQYHDATGGWYDAGDLRKWMTMSTLPVLGFLDMHERLGLKRNHFSDEAVSDNDFITESIWGLKFILKMQDPQSGMIFEEVGAGGEGRKQPGMTWWYENHSGCLADNSQNHFTDNIKKSGDERIIRTSYNPIVQYTNLFILLRAAHVLHSTHSGMASGCEEAARRIWNFTQGMHIKDPLHDWTSVRSWRLSAGLMLHKNNWIDDDLLTEMVNELLENWSRSLGFWYMDDQKSDPYRGILHSAQPLIALSQFLEMLPDHPRSVLAREILEETWIKYIQPLLDTNPFDFMPYGVFLDKKTPGDTYHPFLGGKWFRYFMPEHSPQKINHGLGGHWTSWAHGLAFMGKMLNNQDMTDAAWAQLYWTLGFNPLNSCLVSGVGYNNPMPHSRFFGTHTGGFCVGPRGSMEDEAVIDLKARAEWSSTEYWLTPLSNTLMALSILLPKSIKKENKIGIIGYN